MKKWRRICKCEKFMRSLCGNRRWRRSRNKFEFAQWRIVAIDMTPCDFFCSFDWREIIGNRWGTSKLISWGFWVALKSMEFQGDFQPGQTRLRKCFNADGDKFKDLTTIVPIGTINLFFTTNMHYFYNITLCIINYNIVFIHKKKYCIWKPND